MFRKVYKAFSIDLNLAFLILLQLFLNTTIFSKNFNNLDTEYLSSPMKY